CCVRGACAGVERRELGVVLELLLYGCRGVGVSVGGRGHRPSHDCVAIASNRLPLRMRTAAVRFIEIAARFSIGGVLPVSGVDREAGRGGGGLRGGGGGGGFGVWWGETARLFR